MTRRTSARRLRRMFLLLLLILCLPRNAWALEPVGTVGPTRTVAPADNATQPRAGQAWTEPVTGMEFRWIPAGCFDMGSPEGEPGREPDEGPVHRVCLDGFWMGRTEVTGGQWKAITGEDPSLIKNEDTYPVDMVSWDMAQDYVQRLNARAGGGYRLPTEAEWEYACRAGTDTAYFFGPEISHDQAAFDKRFSLPAEPPAPSRRSKRRKSAPKPRIWPNMHTSVAGSYPANAFGLSDMHGNLWEWCQDVYDEQYYAASPEKNPRKDEGGVSRVLRGGAWVTRADTLRCANRGFAWPDLRTSFYGLRLVRDPRSSRTP